MCCSATSISVATHFACRDTYMTMRLGASIAGFADRRRPQPRSPQRCDELIPHQARTHTPYLVALASSHASREMIFGADETTTVQLKRGKTVANTAQSAPTTQKGSGAHRVRKIFSRIYGSLAILLGFFGIALGVFAILARSTGRTYGDFIEKPDAVPAIFGPYVIVV